MGPFSTTSQYSGLDRQGVEVRLDLQMWMDFWGKIEKPFGCWKVGKCGWGGRQTASLIQGYRLCSETWEGCVPHLCQKSAEQVHPTQRQRGCIDLNLNS